MAELLMLGKCYVPEIDEGAQSMASPTRDVERRWCDDGLPLMLPFNVDVGVGKKVALKLLTRSYKLSTSPGTN